MINEISDKYLEINILEELDFDEIYEEYYKKIYRYVSYRVNNTSDIEDIVSKIFLKIYSKIDSYNKETGNISPWIFTIAGNTVKDYYRKNSIRKFFSLDSLEKEPEYDFSIEENTEKQEEFLKLREAVKKLSKKDRDLVSLKYGAELSYKEIAEIMDITETYVGVRLHRCLKELKKSMEGYYEE